jgi:hypothetical protein
MKLKLSYEQYDTLRMTLASLRGVIQTDRDYFRNKGWESTAKLMEEYIANADKALDTSSLSKVEMVD